MRHGSRLFMFVFCLVVLLITSSAVVLAGDTVHIVQPGDTVSEIARQHGTSVAMLRRLNNLDDIDFIWSGQRLLLSENASNTRQNVADSRVEEPATDEETMPYIVQPGDTLESIALNFRTSLARLSELNQIYPGQQLAMGRELTVPRVIHLVRAGEHLGAIAARYKTTPWAIAQVNSLADPNRIVPGQRLTIVPASQVERAGAVTKVDASGYHVHTDFPTTTEKWIDVSLSEQRVVAYEGTKPVRAFIVSTGLPATPTVTGTFRMWTRTPIQDMSGGNRAAGTYYYLKDVQWVQYFYKDYAFHGTYWHNNFGRPMSRGCVNMTIEDAKWLFDWAFPEWNGSRGWFGSTAANATLVVVHE